MNINDKKITHFVFAIAVISLGLAMMLVWDIFTQSL